MAKITTGKQAAVGFAIMGEEKKVGFAVANLEVEYGDGNKRRIEVANLSPEILSAALIHGLRQKLGDAAAIARNTETGASATLADKIAAVEEVAQRLIAGQWNKTQAGAGAAKTTLLIEALAVMAKKPVAEMAELLKGKTDDEKKALRANHKVQAEIAKIEAKRAAEKAKAAGTDGSELLASLGL